MLQGVSKMIETFQANCLATLIGSLPLTDHEEACDLIMEYIPEVPFWAQLPSHKKEGMMVQFAAGLPGFYLDKGSGFINTGSASYDSELLEFFEDYMAVIEKKIELDSSRFALKEDDARGFFVFLERLQTAAVPPIAVKGQITGPFTLGTGVVDQNKRPIFYDSQLRDTVVKLLAMKARWQARRLSLLQRPVMIFFDEPALAGFGSSEFTSVSKEDIRQCFEEVCEAVHLEGGLAGVHICANTDWSLVLDSSADIVSFDAYAFFDRFILYPDQIKRFLESDKILAWGIVPTLNVEQLEKETASSLLKQLDEQFKQIESLGIDAKKLIGQSLITPSCGTGSLSIDLAKKVLSLTSEISHEIRRR
jgi:methionine synthase II (cobalamin-independent)